jgi:magnesium chelatase subunit D
MEEQFEEEQMEQQQEEELEPEQDEETEDVEELLLPAEFLFGVDSVPIDPKLLHFKQWTKKGKGGKRSRIFNLERGRFIKAIFPQGNRGRVAVGSTLRSAAPHQLLRRRLAEGTRHEGKLIYIRKDDFRIKRMARKAGSLVVFVVDASGSMALNRMGAAKGAALTFLKEAYKCRDKICLIAFHENKAETIVPPTKSMALTKSRLEGMPCGGGSPLTHALMMAMKIGVNTKKIKQDVGRVVIVLLTDGRNNVPMCVSEGEEFDPSVDPESKNGAPSRKFLRDEALAVAKMLAALDDFNLLCIDTEDKFVGTGIARDITAAAGGTYVHLAMSHKDSSNQIASLVRQETA